jgi:hypothetical protein
MKFEDFSLLKKKYYNLTEIKSNSNDQKSTPEEDPANLEHSDKIIQLKRKAEEIKALANLKRSENEYNKAKIEEDRIKKDKDQQLNPVKVVPPSELVKDKNLNIDETLAEKSSDIEPLELYETTLRFLREDDNSDSGQTKEEAEIAKIQAETEKIKSEANNTSEPLEDTNPDSNIPSENVPLIPGIPEQSNDELAGMGDATAKGTEPADPSNPISSMGGGITLKTSTSLGRIYTLRKLYYRLAGIDNILSNTTNKELAKLAEVASEVFSIFKMIIINLKSYKDNIDNIIVMYYEFIKEISGKLLDYYNIEELNN